MDWKYLRWSQSIFIMDNDSTIDAHENHSHKRTNCLQFKSMDQINDERCNNEELHINRQIPCMHETLRWNGKKLNEKLVLNLDLRITSKNKWIENCDLNFTEHSPLTPLNKMCAQNEMLLSSYHLFWVKIILSIE